MERAVVSAPRRLPTEIMSQREHSITIKLVWNDNGAPVVPISRDARVSLSVDTCDSTMAAASKLPGQPRTVSIHGNRAGLVALAEQILAVAQTDIERFHQHFDAECPTDFLDSDAGWGLIVGRNDNRAIRKVLSNG